MANNGNETIRDMANRIVKLGLVTLPRMQEVLEEIGPTATDLEELLRLLERRSLLTPYQSGKLIKGDTDGYFLGGYRLLYKIASGSFGRVFRADDPQTGRIVAIKVLRRRWSEDAHAIGLFEREGKLGQTLQHPNIVEILTVSHDASTGQYFIVMEFVEGGNLREILATRQKFEPAEALRIMEEAATGLAYAYAKGITHRDMKLTNVLISSTGVAKLVDFGLAGLFSAGFGRKEDGQVDRTVDYAGLEKTTGVKHGDVRSDIYFMGCVLYEMLTGRSPIAMTKDKYQRMQRHRFAEVTPMARDEVNGPSSLFQLVETMMALEPAQRYQTPSQLLEAIRSVRRDIETGKDSGAEKPASASAAQRSVFVVEKKERLQDALRHKLKELGYRVLLSADPVRALDRFRQQPFDALVVDAGTTGEEGLHIFDKLLAEADRKTLSCAGILVLTSDQANWARKVPERPRTVVLVGPTLKQLHHKLQALVPPQ
jgi:serine/threonine protein kinase